jgi:glutamyl-tRNA synthetase
MKIKVRIAPSPSGYIHPGNARSAIINSVFARSVDGNFYIRIDDTNSETTSEEFIQNIYKDLEWLSISNNGKYVQSERTDLYKFTFEILKKSGRIYPCIEDFQNKSTGSYIHHIRRNEIEILNPTPDQLANSSWRFEILNTKSSWNDIATGYEEYDVQKITGDPVVFRKDGSITYLLASVIDDIFMNITHIIRGKDHTSNTAIQIQMFDAIKNALSALSKEFDLQSQLDSNFSNIINKYSININNFQNHFQNIQNFPEIKFAHLPLLSFEDGAKLSKRNNSLSISSLREKGILPMTINNYLMSIGTSELSEFSTMEEMVNHFKKINFEEFLTNLGKSSACFSQNTLLSLNQKMLSKLSIDEISQLWSTKINEPQWNVIKDNIEYLSQLSEWEDIFYNEEIVYDEILKKNEYINGIFPSDYELLNFFTTALMSIPENTSSNDAWDKWIAEIKNSTSKKGKEIFMPMRLALTGMEHGPKMNEIIRLIPRNIIQNRISHAKK